MARAAFGEQLQIITDIGKMVHLSFVPVDLSSREARYPIQKEGSEAPLEEDGAPGHQVGDGLPLLLSSLPSISKDVSRICNFCVLVSMVVRKPLC